MKPVRIAVVGAGHMGKLHAAKVAALGAAGGEAVLVAVADVDAGRAREVAAAHGVRAVADLRELAGELDAAIVAVPTVAHGAVVGVALELGLDVLVEKPIAATSRRPRRCSRAPKRAARCSRSAISSGSTPRCARWPRACGARASSRATAWARSRPARPTSTWCATS